MKKLAALIGLLALGPAGAARASHPLLEGSLAALPREAAIDLAVARFNQLTADGWGEPFTAAGSRVWAYEHEQVYWVESYTYAIACYGRLAASGGMSEEGCYFRIGL